MKRCHVVKIRERKVSEGLADDLSGKRTLGPGDEHFHEEIEERLNERDNVSVLLIRSAKLKH